MEKIWSCWGLFWKSHLLTLQSGYTELKKMSYSGCTPPPFPLCHQLIYYVTISDVALPWQIALKACIVLKTRTMIEIFSKIAEMPLLLCRYKITTLSRTLMDLRVLPCLQTERLACHCFWQKMWDSWVKRKALCSPWLSRQCELYVCIIFLCLPSPRRTIQSGQVEAIHVVHLCHS